MKQKLDYIICGTQKGGTTALDRFLSQVDGIETAKIKEIHFFDNDNLNWENPDYSILHAHFNWDYNYIIRGEATPIYMYWPSAVERIYNYNPNIKLIFCLRHPVYRAFSHWKMEYMRGEETHSFEDAISNIGRERVKTASNSVHRVYSYIERGFYDEQIKNIFRFVPPENCLFVKTDNLWNEITPTINCVCSFIGAKQQFNIEKKYIVPINTKQYGEIDRNIFFQILKIFEQSILNTEALTGLNMKNWLDASYQEHVG